MDTYAKNNVFQGCLKMKHRNFKKLFLLVEKKQYGTVDHAKE